LTPAGLVQQEALREIPQVRVRYAAEHLGQVECQPVDRHARQRREIVLVDLVRIDLGQAGGNQLQGPLE
jgi:hypothetical protein